MKRLFLAATAVASLVLPAAALAAPGPSGQDRANAARECRAELGSDDASREAFMARYGNFGKCVSRRAHDEQSERRAAARNAAQTCRHERGDTPEEHAAFREKYATKGGERSAFGRCVSQHARAEMQQEDTEDVAERAARRNAARACDEERSETDASRAAFRKKYGTNSGRSSAFGRCVSQSARAQLEGGSSGV